MITFLLFISLFLNVLALLLIIILFLRQNQFLHVEKKQEKMLQEMEEVISAYLVQMKEENEEFINRISTISKKTKKFDKNAIPKKEVEQVKKLEIENNVSLQNRVGKVNAQQVAKAYKQNYDESNVKHSEAMKSQEVELPPLESESLSLGTNSSENKTSQENSLLNDILLLKNQGYNETEIAQKLNKGKTEIALLLKFNQNNEE